MKIVAADKDKTVVAIPMIVWIGIVRVKPRVIIVVVDIEHLEATVRVRLCAKYLPLSLPDKRFI